MLARRHRATLTIHRLRARRTVLCAAVLALLLGGLVGCGGEGLRPGTVDGYVYIPIPPGDPSSLATPAQAPPGYQPAAGAQVAITSVAAPTATDSSGYFIIGGVSPGTQTLTVSLAGYNTATLQLEVTSGLVTRAVPDTGIRLTPATRKWTVMVFLNADNDLEEFGILNMNQMEMVGSSGAVDIVVQMDRVPGYDATNGDWTGCRRYRITHDTDTAIINSPVLQEMGEVDMGDPLQLRDFISWAQTNFPAPHYCLVLWNHGAGYRTRTAGTRGISFDDTSHTNIFVQELPGVLAAGQPIEMVAFDASLMQMAEVIYELRNSCQVAVGSEESPPGEGYPYNLWLAPLVANPDMTATQLGRVIADQTIFYYTYTRPADVTQSVVDTSKISAVAMAADALAGAALADGGANTTALVNARNNAQRYAYSEYKDLYHYSQLIRDNVPAGTLQSSAQAVMDAVVASVTHEAQVGTTLANSHGLSVYVPAPGMYSHAYDSLAWSVNTRWDDWAYNQP